MGNYNKELGKRIYNARKVLDMTMKELGAKVGLHESTVKRYETSGVTGVRWHKKSQMWHASIGFQKKYYSLGYYHDIKKAAKIRQVAEKELFGNFIDWYYETFPQKRGKKENE